MAGFAAVERGEKVGDLVHEGVLVADAETGDPPLVEVGMVAVGDVDAAPTADVAFVGMILKSVFGSSWWIVSVTDAGYFCP